MEGNADFSARWWPKLTQWEAYLEKYGRDPENQLCTDDFMGHLAHNANLSIKAILAIAAYGELCRLRGDDARAGHYQTLARQYARHWIGAADDGDHYRIAFDKPNTWSQKYNLVWDKLLGLKVFPAEVAAKEVALLQKGHSTVWCTPRLSHSLDQDGLVRVERDLGPRSGRLRSDRVADSRLPQPDHRAAAVCRFLRHGQPQKRWHAARPVIGGVFIKMLEDPKTWKKWSNRDRANVGDWAPAPIPPRVTEVVPTSRRQPMTWRYTFQKPDDDWSRSGFDDSHWKQGPGGFGTRGTPGAVVGTTWNTPDIWLRREITIPANTDADRLQLLAYHDEDVEIYLNGVLAARKSGYVTTYESVEIHPAAHRSAPTQYKSRARRSLPPNYRRAGDRRWTGGCRRKTSVDVAT